MGTKSRAQGNNMLCNMWKNHEIVIDIDSKRSSSRCLRS